MRLDRLDVYYVAMPLIYPWRTAYGEDWDIHSVLVKGTSGDAVAWTETTPFFAPTYLTESANWEFAAFVNNVLDEEYLVQTFELGLFLGMTEQYFGRPQWYGATFTYNFN